MNLKSKYLLISVIFFLLFNLSAYSNVRLPKLISNGMVLQRNAKIKIWGWADKNEKITINFLGSLHSTVTNANGDWAIILSNLKAGGPFKMEITANNSITIEDILVGDVWVCSGQSNMEFPVSRCSVIYGQEVANSTNDFIRHFYVPREYSFNKICNDLSSGVWKKANPENVLDFSAIAWFFAKELYERNRIPIGLINTSLGGSPVEAWMSEDALKKFPQHYNEAIKFKDTSLINQVERTNRMINKEWHQLLRQKDEGYKSPEQNWWSPSLNTSDWASMEIPGYWANSDLGAVNGVVWFRKEIQIPATLTGKKAKLILGRIIDADSVFVNGTFVGTIIYQYPPRRYDIPQNLLVEGKNIIVVRVISYDGIGGFVPDKDYRIEFEEDTIDVKGDWKFRLGAEMKPMASQITIRYKPLGLFNAMIAPLLNYSIKGVIWYQGESNSGRSVEYASLFPALISNWREKWQQGNFPFLFVQLPNYLETREQPSESVWAYLREAQFKTLSVPNTGMAVAIDLGEWNDIHPLNKKDVGHRLALIAQKLVFKDKNVVYSGPVYQSMKIVGGKVTLSFKSIGTGLATKDGGELKYFAIAGADKQFIWAKAEIKGNKIIVWNDKVLNPVAVRYAWADNPKDANLYNKEGLPASPFRTDNWTLKP